MEMYIQKVKMNLNEKDLKSLTKLFSDISKHYEIAINQFKENGSVILEYLKVVAAHAGYCYIIIIIIFTINIINLNNIYV